MMEPVNEPFLAFRTTEKGRVMLNLFGGTELEVTEAPDFLSKVVEAQVNKL